MNQELGVLMSGQTPRHLLYGYIRKRATVQRFESPAELHSSGTLGCLLCFSDRSALAAVLNSCRSPMSEERWFHCCCGLVAGLPPADTLPICLELSEFTTQNNGEESI
jgi:hypothetical protein